MKKIKAKIKTDESMLDFLGKKYKLPQFEKSELNVQEFTDFNIRNYENDLEKLPSLLNILGILQAKALKAFHKAEAEYKIWVAQKDKEKREFFENKKIKYTEAKISNEILIDPEYLLKKKKLFLAEENYEILKSIYWAVTKKGEVLIEVSRQRSNLNKLDKMRMGDI